MGSLIYVGWVIPIIEADLNFMMSHVWGRKLMYYSESRKIVRNEQYGGRKHIRAQSLVLNKLFSYDNSNIMRLEAAQVEIDATNCYDRIIPYQAVITSQRHGMDYKSAVFIAIVLKLLQHHIKVSTGTSEKYFTNKDKRKFMVQDKAQDGFHRFGETKMTSLLKRCTTTVHTSYT